MNKIKNENYENKKSKNDSSLDSEKIEVFNLEIEKQNELERNSVYINVIEIVSKFLILLNLTETNIFENDSLLINNLIKLLKNCLLVLSNEKTKFMSYKNISINIKEFYNTLKVKYFI